MNSQSSKDRQPDINAAQVALEERLTYQQLQLDQLNEVILEQQASISTFRHEVNSLKDIIRELMERTGDNLPHERPPHY